MKKILLSLWICFLAGTLIIVSLFYLIASGFMGDMPSFEELENPNSSIATEVISTDNKMGSSTFKTGATSYMEISIPIFAMPYWLLKTSATSIIQVLILERCFGY
jgi:penicillin-binding protein 1A